MTCDKGGQQVYKVWLCVIRCGWCIYRVIYSIG